MIDHSCHEKRVGLTYCYTIEIEWQLLKCLPSNYVSTTTNKTIIRTISALLKINALQCSMLSWLLQRQTYVMNDLLPFINDFHHFAENEAKYLFFVILLNGYYVKDYLSGASSEIDAQVLEIVPNFGKIYSSWQPNNRLAKVQLSDLNKKFNLWSQHSIVMKKDYNILVNQILQLSKSYNVGGKDCKNQEEVQYTQMKVRKESSNQLMQFQSKDYQRKGLEQVSSPFERQDEELYWEQKDEEFFQMLKRSSGKMKYKDISEQIIDSRGIFEARKNSDYFQEISKHEPIKQIQRESRPQKIKPTLSFINQQ